MIKGQFDDRKLRMDIYTLRGQEERIKGLKLQLQQINKDLLSVEDAEELELI